MLEVSAPLKRRKPWRRSGHCFYVGPWGMVILIIVGLGPPLATLIKIVSSIFGADDKLGEKKTDARLPVIKGLIVTAKELGILEVSTETSEAHCPVCATSLAKEETVACPRCETLHHKDCWEFNGACAVFGCGIEKTRPRPAAADPVKAAAMAEALPDFLALRRRFRRWFWVVRLQWWSVLWLCFSLAFPMMLHALGVRAGPVYDLLYGPGLLALGSSAFLCLGVRFARWRLETSQERLPLVPPERMTALLKRVEGSKTRPLIESFVHVVPFVYFTLGIISLVGALVVRYELMNVLNTMAVVLWGGFFVWMAKVATRRHRAALEQVRCRLRGASKV